MKYNPKLVSMYYKQMGLPLPVFEHQHIPGRQFRLDIAFPDYKLGIEVQGGVYKNYRNGHTSISGILRDMEKNNLGILAGWRVFIITPEEVCMMHTVKALKTMIHLYDKNLTVMCPTITDN